MQWGAMCPGDLIVVGAAMRWPTTALYLAAEAFLSIPSTPVVVLQSTATMCVLAQVKV